MISLIKFLKIVLPVATVTTATIATVSLVSFKKIDLDQNRDNEDRVLDDFELKAKDFKEKKMLYSKDGKNDSVTLEDDTLAEEILKKFQNGEDLGEFEGKVPDIEKIKKFLSESKDTSGNKPSEVNSEMNNGDAGLPKQASSQQKDLPETISDQTSGITSDQMGSDDLDAKSKESKSVVSEQVDKGEEDVSGDQNEKDLKLTAVSKGLNNSEPMNEIQNQGGEEGQSTMTDSDTVDDSQSSAKQEPQIEANGKSTESTADLEGRAKDSVAKTSEEGRSDVPKEPDQDSTQPRQVASEAIDSREVSGERKNSINSGTYSDGGKQLSLKEIQELEALEKEMENLKDSLQQLSR